MDSINKNKKDVEGEREREAADILMEDGTAEGVCANQVVRARPGPKCSKRRAVKEEERREKRAEEVRERRAISPGSSASTLGYLSEEEILGPIEPVPVSHSVEEPPHQQQGEATEDVEQAAPSEASSKSRDPRGRKAKDPSHAGRYAGVGKARDEARKSRYARKMAEEEIEEREAQREAARMGLVLRRVGPHSAETSKSARGERSLARSVKVDPARQSVGDLATAIDVAVGSVLEIAGKSSNLRGKLVRDLKGAARDVKESADELHLRAVQTGDADGLRAEVANLRLQNECLQQEVLRLRATVDALKERMAKPSTDGPRDIQTVPGPSAVTPQPAPLPQRKAKRRRSKDSSTEPFALPTLPPPKKRADRREEAEWGALPCCA